MTKALVGGLLAFRAERVLLRAGQMLARSLEQVFALALRCRVGQTLMR
jgi:hypothetical protein